MKPGHILKTFRTKKNKLITLRFISGNDAKGLMCMINSVISEDDYIVMNKRVTLKQEIDWVKNEIKNLKINKKVQLLACEGKLIIGNCGIQKSTDRKSHIGQFGISIIDGYREEGIGTFLAKEAIKQAKKYLDIKLLKLTVYNTNSRAQKLYTNLGFKKYGILPKGIKVKNKYIDTIYMYKEL